MKKRSLIFGIAMLVGLALIFSGCETEATTETVTVNNGAAGDLAGLQKLLNTDGVNTVDFYGTLAIGAEMLIIPAGKTVTVKDGGVTLSGGTLVVVGTLTLPADEKITGTAGAVIALEAYLTANVATGSSLTPVKIQSGGTIVPDETFAVSGNITISGDDTSATNIVNTAFDSSSKALYVIGNLAVSKAIGQAITVGVLGNATVSSDTDETAAVNWLVSGTLTASKTPTAATGTIKAETLDLSGVTAAAAITIGEADVGELKTNANVTITTGTTDGLTAGTVTGAAVFAASAEITKADFAGAVEFKGAATVTEADFASAVKFGGAATLGEVSFGENVTVTDAAALKLTDGETVTLASDKSIVIYDATTPITVLTASATTVLTPGSGTTLTPATTGKKLTIGVAGLGLTSGVLVLAEDAALDIASGQTLTVASGAALTAGKLIIGAGEWKASAAAATIAADTLTLGNASGAAFGKDDGTSATVLTGTATTTNTFTASGANVILTQATNALSITGLDATAKLATGATAGIKVKAGLTITSVTVDISAAATSVITLVNGDTAGITLAGANSVILLDDTKTTVTSAKKAITDLTVGASVIVKAETDAGDKEVGSFTGADATNTIVEDGSNDFSIKKGIKTDA